jgi:hypothetical protein
MMADRPHRLERLERHTRIYRMFLLAYPASFRKEYEEEMVLVFRDLLGDASRRGRMELALTWFRVLVDLVRTASQERVRAWQSSKRGGTAVEIQSMLTRRLTSHNADCRMGQIFVFAMSLLIPFLIIKKFTSMPLTEGQMLLGILIAAALSLQMIGFGLLLPLDKPADRSWSLAVAGQIVAYALPILLFILGVWQVSRMTMSEYEFMLALLLMLHVTMACILIVTIGIIVRAARPEPVKPERTKSVGPAS